MLKIKGNKEFVAWWEHWMARIHPNRTPAGDPKLVNSRTKELKSETHASLDPSSAPFWAADGQTRRR
jgi:hypothetical protein